MRLLHGTSSRKAALIAEHGFLAGSYFTRGVDDAVFYAATGGEEDLQRREEEWEAAHGYPPREDYGSDVMSMMRDLYPDGDRPVIIVIDMPDNLASQASADSGAEGGLCLGVPVPAEAIVDIIDVDWDLAEMEGYNPLAATVCQNTCR